MYPCPEIQVSTSSTALVIGTVTYVLSSMSADAERLTGYASYMFVHLCRAWHLKHVGAGYTVITPVLEAHLQEWIKDGPDSNRPSTTGALLDQLSGAY